MTSCGVDRQANLEKGEAFCREAARLGADIALFPEMWSIGYANVCPPERNPGDLWRAPGRFEADLDPQFEAELAEWRTVWHARAVGVDDEFVMHFRRLARSLDMAIALTYLERWPGGPRNSVSVIDRRGEIVLTYAKVHTCAFDVDEAGLTPGDDFPVVALDTAHGPVMVGAMICMDREFPESARLLMLNGAEVILTPNACEMDLHRMAQFRTRAFENMTAVALANYAAPEANGHSVAFDPIAFGD
ncbi:MAG: carbon-nitrogen hydrolase family protein, partial [Thermomicrobiales bacterium]|nr:carbon-nitrogen hydrolase family protein [Thermomicrobiales bacterium]